MGQNRKIRKSRHKNKLKKNRIDSFESSVAAPLQKVEPQLPLFPNYDFKAEVEKDWDNEKRLFRVELAVLFGILLFVFLRSYLLTIL